MYLVIGFYIARNSLHCKRILTTSTIVIFSGLLAYFPSCIANIFDITIGYEVAQIATITFYYTSSVINPLVYFCLHPRAKVALRVWVTEIKQCQRMEQRDISITNSNL